MTWLVPYLVFFHVLGVVFAFGPTFSYSIWGGMIKDEPQHRDFFARGRDRVSAKLTWPATLSLFVTGVLIIVAGGYQVHLQPMRWLLISIVLYIGMVLYIRFVLDPLNQRISAMGKAAREAAAARAAAAGSTAGGMPGGAPTGTPGAAPAGATGGPPAGAGGPPAGAGGPPGGGPPPELMRMIARTRRDGKILGIVVIVIIFLMVVKPAFPI
jgi:hypothetical protein